MLPGLLGMLFIFWALPRWSVWLDTREWSADPRDKYGQVWHRQRMTVRGLIVGVAAVAGHFFWLHHHPVALLLGIGLSIFLGGAYYQFDFNPRLNQKRHEKEPWVTKWYVSRSATTATFDKLLCQVADNLNISTEVVLRRLLQRTLEVATIGYGVFLLLVLGYVQHISLF